MTTKPGLLDQLQDAMHFIAARQDHMIDTVIKWSNVNSGSRNLGGLARMEALILDYAQDLQCDIQLIDLEPTQAVDENGRIVDRENGRCIRLIKRPGVNRRMLLTGHTDTVFAADSSFQTARWLDTHTINGPGVTDMKGGILVMLNALMAFERTGLCDRVGYDVLLSPDEETGSHASARYLAEFARAAHIGLTYEPSMPDGTLAGERKGSGNYTVVVKGQAAHAGRDFHKGRNAVVHLSYIIQALSALTDKRDGLTLNAAVIKGGTAPNVVPDMAFCRFNVRLKRQEDGDWVQRQIEKIVEHYQAEQGFEVILQGGINRPPKHLSKANLKLMDVVRDCGAALGLRIDYASTGGCCEGNNLAAAGLPNVDTLGVRGGHIHSQDEYLLVDSLVERTKLSLLVMAAFARGDMDQVLALSSMEN